MSGSRSSLLASLTLLAALVGAGSAAAENVVRFTSDEAVHTFDPHSVWHLETIIATQQVYDKLLNINYKLEVEPSLAASWRIVDPRTWVFELRQGVRFHDGTPLTADDVVFSIDRARGADSEFAFILESIVQVEAVDPDTVRITTKKPNAMLPMQVRMVHIMSKHWATQHGVLTAERSDAAQETYASRHANGSGPFRLVAIEPHKSYVLERNPDWWGRDRWPHNIDRIEGTFSRDYPASLQALLDGRTTLLTWPLPEQLEQLKDTPGIKLVEGNTIRSTFLVLNQGIPELRTSNIRGRNPFQDRRVRQAIYQAIDVQRLIRDVQKGYGLPAGMLIAPGVNGYAPELDQRLPYDPKKAKALLAQAGYPDGFRVQLDTVGYSSDSELVAAMLRQVGINVDLVMIDDAEMNQKIASHDTDFYIRQCGYATLDSLETFKLLYRSGARNNVSAAGYSNPRVDELIATLDTEMTTYGRDALIEQIWHIVLDDIAYVPLYHVKWAWAMRDESTCRSIPISLPLSATRTCGRRRGKPNSDAWRLGVRDAQEPGDPARPLGRAALPARALHGAQPVARTRASPGSVEPRRAERQQVAVGAQPAAVRLEAGQDLADQAPELALMVAHAQVAELVHDHVLEHRLGRQDQAPVEIDQAARRAAAPDPLLVLDPEPLRHQAVRRAVARAQALGVEPRLAAEPAGERRLDPMLALALQDADREPDLEAVAVVDRHPEPEGGLDLELDRTAAVRDPAAVGEPGLARMRGQRPPQPAHLVQQPVPVLLDEPDDLGLAHADRRHDLDAVRLDGQAQPPGAGAPAQPVGDRGRADQERGQASSRSFRVCPIASRNRRAKLASTRQSNEHRGRTCAH
jgi:peptide/nickel transport system substrate-binding protein